MKIVRTLPATFSDMASEDANHEAIGIHLKPNVITAAPVVDSTIAPVPASVRARDPDILHGISRREAPAVQAHEIRQDLVGIVLRQDFPALFLHLLQQHFLSVFVQANDFERAARLAIDEHDGIIEIEVGQLRLVLAPGDLEAKGIELWQDGDGHGFQLLALELLCLAKGLLGMLDQASLGQDLLEDGPGPLPDFRVWLAFQHCLEGADRRLADGQQPGLGRLPVPLDGVAQLGNQLVDCIR